MSFDSDLVASVPSGVIRGEIATTATEDSDHVGVLLPIDDWQKQHGPFRWPIYGDGTRPRRGDYCTVVVDGADRMTLATWEPKDTDG